jgi:AcrR family transcriptional regulator
MASQLTRMPREQRRAQLLEAASEVFTAKGYHAAAMDDIAEAAGVSKPVLYQHFGSKLDLYLALLDQACERLVDLVSDALASTEDNAERVVATMTAFYSMVSSERAEFRLIFESDLTGESAVEERIWRVNNDVADRIADVIAEDTGLGRERSKLLAISLVGIGQVSARYWVTAGTVELSQARQLVSDLAWRGISGFPLSEQAGLAHRVTGGHAETNDSAGQGSAGNNDPTGRPGAARVGDDLADRPQHEQENA